MKHNPRVNEKVARFAGIGDLHPLQPISTVQGALELIDRLAHWLKTLTGMPAVAMSPAAGAHGEMCGMMAIAAALEAKGELAQRRTVLAPELAHGTNPATAAALGFTVKPIPANEIGRVDLAALEAALGPDVAAIMLTNPNTCGLFELEIVEISRAVHAAGADSTATAPTSTPSSAGFVRAISASTACTSTCTRPSRRRTAAANQARGRWCCRPRWRRTRLTRGS